MDLIRDHKNVTNEYSKKIRIIKYTEGENITIEKEGVKDICEIIISQNDHNYSTIQKQQRENYIINKKLEIADNVTKNEKYNKNFTPKIIQTGLQSKNYLSSILYMNELYKVNTVICNSDKQYKTTFMNYPILLCEYKNNSWHYIETENVDVEYNPTVELPSVITQDTNLMIFKSNMMPLSKYKVKDLENMCEKNNINIMKKGKKKLKKELYDELSLHCLIT
jgi:hypothetical protein